MLVRVLLLLLGVAPSAHATVVLSGPWIGGVTSSGAVAVARLSDARLSTLEVGEDRDLTRPLTFAEQLDAPGAQPELARYRLFGLRPDTTYFYRLRAGATPDPRSLGSFRTFPTEGQPAAFRFAFGASAPSGSDAAVFAEIRYQEPRFFIHLGGRPTATSDDASSWRERYDLNLRAPTQADLHRAVPLAVLPGAAADEAAARRAFREYVPHYPPAGTTAPDESRSLSQAFTFGRIRFVLWDAAGDPDRRWLHQELLAAAASHPLVFLAGTPPEHNNALPELRAWVGHLGLPGVCLLAAGSGSADADLPAVFSSGELDGAAETDPGARPEGRFGLVEVHDDGAAVHVRFRGLDHSGRAGTQTELTFPAPQPDAR